MLINVLIYPADEPMTEAEVPFGVVDAVAKGLARCTGTILAAEVSVHRSDTINTSPEHGECSGSIPITPARQKLVSSRSVPDYTFYTLCSPQSHIFVCGIIEVKTEQNFDDNAICQTIGYHIARKSGLHFEGMYSNTPDIHLHVYVQSRIVVH